jgi:hypothetical protein
MVASAAGANTNVWLPPGVTGVVTEAVLLGPEALPAASRAFTVYTYVVDATTVVSDVDVLVTDLRSVSFRYTS